MIRVGIVEMDPLSAIGLRFLLGGKAGLQVTFATSDLDRIDQADFDCLVLDARLLPGWRARQTPDERSAYPIVCLAADEHATAMAEAALEVARVLPRAEAPELLLAGIRRTVGAPEAAPAPAAGILSPREQEVLNHIAAGCTHGQVAYRIGISHHTVDTYVKRIRAKLGVGNKAQLVRAALTIAAAA